MLDFTLKTFLQTFIWRKTIFFLVIYIRFHEKSFIKSLFFKIFLFCLGWLRLAQSRPNPCRYDLTTRDWMDCGIWYLRPTGSWTLELNWNEKFEIYSFGKYLGYFLQIQGIGLDFRQNMYWNDSFCFSQNPCTIESCEI